MPKGCVMRYRTSCNPTQTLRLPGHLELSAQGRRLVCEASLPPSPTRLTLALPLICSTLVSILLVCCEAYGGWHWHIDRGPGVMP